MGSFSGGKRRRDVSWSLDRTGSAGSSVSCLAVTWGWTVWLCSGKGELLSERGGLGTRVGTPGTSARHVTRPSLPGAQGSLPPLHFPSALGRVGPGPGPLPPCSKCFTCHPALFTQTLCLPAVSFWKHTAHSHCVGWRGGGSRVTVHGSVGLQGLVNRLLWELHVPTGPPAAGRGATLGPVSLKPPLPPDTLPPSSLFEK